MRRIDSIRRKKRYFGMILSLRGRRLKGNGKGAVFANLPKYLSSALEGIQKRALMIIFPNLHYDEALILSGLLSLEGRRATACESFIRNLKPSNPVFSLAMSGRVTTVHSYSLRNCRNYNKKLCKAKILSEFISVKYLDFLS